MLSAIPLRRGRCRALPVRSLVRAAALLLTMLGAGLAAGCERAAPEMSEGEASAYVNRLAEKRDTVPAAADASETYMGRRIAPVMGHRGAAWLERPEREQSELPGRVVDALELQPTDTVADIGAGTGYFAFRIAPRVPRGLVYAVDIQPEMLGIVRERIEERGVQNMRPVRGSVTDPGLPANSVDVALIVDAYHEFSHPREMIEALREDLKPGGRLVLVEYRGEDPTIPIKPLHKMTEAQAIKEIEAAGLTWRETKDILPQQHFLVFEKPAE